MNVLLCSTATNALGETYSIAVFAQELMNKGHNCCFIAPILGQRYLQTFGFCESTILVLPGCKEKNEALILENKSKFDSFVNKFNPDIVIVADWYEFMSNGYSNNNSYSIHWFKNGIVLGTFDHCGFAPEGVSTKLYINGDKAIKEIPGTKKLYSFIIRPCPHHNNVLESKKNIYYWSVIKQDLPINKEIKNNLKTKLTGSLRPTFIHPIGLWQERSIERIFKKFNVEKDYYTDIFLPIIYKHLTLINEPVNLIVISGRIKTEITKTFKNINIIWKPPLGNADFMEHIQAADFMLTDNLMSSNIGKAIFNNVIPIVFVNSLEITPDKQVLSDFKITNFMSGMLKPFVDNNFLFPYLSFPMGLNELKNMYEENPFSSCFIKKELFNDEISSKLFQFLLSDNEAIEDITENQTNYINQNKRLPDAESILFQVLEKN